MDCPECSKSYADSDGVVTHLTNSHNLSRIEARKQAINASQSSSADSETSSTVTDSTNTDSIALSFDSDREEMLHHLREKYEEVGGLPTGTGLKDVPGYDVDDYVDEFGSIYGAAVIAGKTEVDPDEYNHTADGSKQYSEWELINAIWRLYELTGKASARMMDNGGPYSLNTYQYRFGSWTEALERANIQGPEPSVESSRESRNKHYASADWQGLRSQALERDGYECGSCGMTEEEHQEEFGTGLNVHHVTDIADFENPDDADTLENLETLCAECHGQEHPFSKD